MDEPLPPNTFSDLPRDCLLPAPDFPELGHSHSPAPFPSGSLDPARTAVKRTAEEDPEDPQNRPSKAPRLADSSSDMAEAIVEPEPALKDLISRELSCSVCTDIFHHPVTLTPCLHSFCGSCAARWLEIQPTCPTCRTRIHSTSPNALVASLVTSYLSAHPSAQPRDEKEIEELSELYKPGDKIYINEDGGDSDNSDDEDRHHDDEDDHSESDDEMGLSRHVLTHSVPNFQHFSMVPWPPSPCPCCVPGNPYGYVCPNPLRAYPSHGTRYQHIHAASRQTENNHVICTACTRAIPIGFRGHPDSCGTCGHVSCAKVWECPARPNGGRGWIDTFEAQELFPGLTSEELENPNLIKSTSLPNFNAVEFRIFKQYMVANNHNLNWLSSQFKSFLLRESPTIANSNMICKTCVGHLWSRKAMEWWIEHKHTIVDQIEAQQAHEEYRRQQAQGDIDKLDDDIPSRPAVIPPEGEDREYCWWGYECWTQFTNDEHRDGRSHACAKIPDGERMDTRNLPPEERRQAHLAEVGRVRARRRQHNEELDRARERSEQDRTFIQNIPPMPPYPPPPPPPPPPPGVGDDESERRRHQFIREENDVRHELIAQAGERARRDREMRESRERVVEFQEREAQRQLLNHGVGQLWHERISMGTPFDPLGAAPGESQETGLERLGPAMRYDGAVLVPALGIERPIGGSAFYTAEVVDMPDNVELGEQ